MVFDSLNGSCHMLSHATNASSCCSCLDPELVNVLIQSFLTRKKITGTEYAPKHLKELVRCFVPGSR